MHIVIWYGSRLHRCPKKGPAAGCEAERLADPPLPDVGTFIGAASTHGHKIPSPTHIPQAHSEPLIFTWCRAHPAHTQNNIM